MRKILKVSKVYVKFDSLCKRNINYFTGRVRGGENRVSRSQFVASLLAQW